MKDLLAWLKHLLSEEIYADGISTRHTPISSAGTSSSRLCLVFVDGDRIKIIPFACANNSGEACMSEGVKIALTMTTAALLVVTQDAARERERKRERERQRRKDGERESEKKQIRCWLTIRTLFNVGCLFFFFVLAFSVFQSDSNELKPRLPSSWDSDSRAGNQWGSFLLHHQSRQRNDALNLITLERRWRNVWVQHDHRSPSFVHSHQ